MFSRQTFFVNVSRDDLGGEMRLIKATEADDARITRRDDVCC